EDVTVEGGAAGAFAVASGERATLVVSPPPNMTGTLRVTVAAMSFEDAAGNLNVDAATAEQPFNTVPGAAFDGVVFGDDYGAGVVFAEFDNSTNDLAVDTAEAQAGMASLRVSVPAEGYTGGALVLGPGADVSGFNAVTFWVRADADRTLNVAGFGNTAADDTQNTEINGALPVTTRWAQYTLPIPDPSVLTQHIGLFHFAEGSDEGAYTLWLDEIRYVTLDAGQISNPRPSLDATTESIATGAMGAVRGASAVLSVNGTDVTLDPMAPAFLTYLSSDTSVATVDGSGIITGVGEGSAVITASLLGVPASGTVRVNVGMGCGPSGANLATNGGFESGDFSCIQQFVNGGVQTIVTANAASGTYAALLTVTTPDTDTVIKFANLSPGAFTPGQTIFVAFDLRGAVTPGGVVFAEFFSELTGGGTSSSEILTGGPLFPDPNAATWTRVRTTALTGADTSGGITLQLKAASGAGTANIFLDNVCVSTSACP
ncbi:MAG: hypothetical protein AAFZ18_34275, partial [Myxococcota bacterium]